jgi:hypothetical protein
MRAHRGKAKLAATVASLSVIAALGSGVMGGRTATAAESAGGVSFSWEHTSAQLLKHYVVTPETRSPGSGGGGASAGSTGTADMPEHSPKNPQAPNAAAARAKSSTAAPQSDNTVASPKDSQGSQNGSVPRTSASLIGQEGSHPTCSYFAGGCNPPDMGLAASPDAVLQGVNTQFALYDTAGHLKPGWPVSAQSFYNIPNVTKADGSPCDVSHQSQASLSDPRAVYDPIDHRFWAAMLQYENAFSTATDCPFLSAYFIAVSQTADPNGAWNVYEFEMSNGGVYTADYTQIGFNRDALFFSANMFRADNGPGFYAEVFEASKSQMERGTANFTAEGFRKMQATGGGIPTAVGPFLADTLQPVMTLDGSANGGASSRNGADGIFVDNVDGPDFQNGNLCSGPTDACKGVLVWRMGSPLAHDRGGPKPSLSVTYLPDTKPFYFPPPASQPSCAQCVDGNDLRIPATPVLRNGTVYTAWGTGVNNGTQVVPGIEWAQINVAGENGPSVSTGYFNFSGDTAATYPAMMPDGNGGVAMVYERMSSTVYPEVRYTVRGPESRNFTDPGRLLKAGEASYRPTRCAVDIPVCRWGDYEATTFDGQGRVWFAGEYANTHTSPTVSPWFGRNWGTWIGAIDVNNGG